jgi:hypothetical protein
MNVETDRTDYIEAVEAAESNIHTSTGTPSSNCSLRQTTRQHQVLNHSTHQESINKNDSGT